MPNPSRYSTPTWVLSPSEPRAHRPPPFLRCSAPSAPGPRPVPRFKPGGAASHSRPAASNAARCQQRRAPHAARFTQLLDAAAPEVSKNHAKKRHTARCVGTRTHAAGPHPCSTPTHTRAQHSRTHTHDAGRAGGQAGSAGGRRARPTVATARRDVVCGVVAADRGLAVRPAFA